MGSLRIETRKAIQQLYVSGRLDAATQQMRALIASQSDTPSLDEYKLLSLFHYSNGDHETALENLRTTHHQFPDDIDTVQNIGRVLVLLNRPMEALVWLERLHTRRPDDPTVHDGLAEVYGRLGNRVRARHHGQRALALKDGLAADRAPICTVPDVPLKPFQREARDRNVIAFSLWGDNRRYLDGALGNARMAPEIYPEWRCRFYCGRSVPQDVVGQLLALSADVILMDEDANYLEGLFWRFDVASDPNIDRFLVRDADSLVSLRERAAVEQWLRSPKHFHIIRDYFTHTDLMLAGLWGGVGGVLPPLETFYAPYLKSAVKTANSDQKFLGEIVWPVARQSVLAHDSWFRVGGSRPFPKSAPIVPGQHVGQDASVHPAMPFGQLSHRPGQRGGPTLEGRDRFIFTLTTGRSGTAFLAELLKKGFEGDEVHHERMGFQNLGRTTPDASHFTLFNSVGNVPAVRDFWQPKFAGLRYGATNVYAETSHFLAKAGLMENLGFLGDDAEIHIVILKRDVEKLVWSLANRMDFANLGFTWLFTLDPRYPRNIVNVKPFEAFGMHGLCLWYATEMAARAEYYQRILAAKANLHFHTVSLEDIVKPAGADKLLTALGRAADRGSIELPAKTNGSENWILGQTHRKAIETMLGKVRSDPADLARRYIESGRRIGRPD